MIVLLAILSGCLGRSLPSSAQFAPLPPAQLAEDLPALRKEGGYVGSASCVECHGDEHASWHRTYHRTMTQPAVPGSVLAPFDGTTVTTDGLQYRVSREGDRYWAEMPDPDVMMYVVQGGRKMPWEKIPRVKRPVVMTTGSHHYQTYWVASERYDRLLQTLPLIYLIADRQWIPRESAFMRPPDDRGRFITQWNHHCIRCHSTGGNPGLDDASGMLRTEVGELGISCEACHGPAGAHVTRHREAARKPGPREGRAVDDTIINPERLDHARSSQVCGQCHGVFIMRDEFAMESARRGPLYVPGEDLHRTRYYIQYPRADSPKAQLDDLKRNPEFFRERWWEDGSILAGGREYTALSASACFTRGKMSCLSCHSMHDSDPDDQLKRGKLGNNACVGCHGEPRYTSRISEHTHHAGASSGSECMNCHMPHTTYALLKGIRSHQIESPQIRSSAAQGVPNACNLCHLDRTLEWAGRHLSEWYGQPVPAMTEEQRNHSAVLLWLLKGHAAQRVIASWHLGWEPALKTSGSDWVAPFQAELLADPYGVVRYVAARGMARLPGFEGYRADVLALGGVTREGIADVRQRWQAARTVRSRTGAEVLISADGILDAALMGRWLKERDDRPVTIKGDFPGTGMVRLVGGRRNQLDSRMSTFRQRWYGWGLLALGVMAESAGAAGARESWVYFGTYTGGRSKGIYVSRFNHDTGHLGQPALVAEMTNPSFLALHPGGRHLYAVGETADSAGRGGGTVAAFELNPADGGLRRINVQDSQGSHPCHLTVDRTGRWVMVANYSSGTLSVFGIEKGGGLSRARQVVQHAGSSVNPARQKAPHAHSIQLDPRNRHVLSADLGIDKVMVYDFDERTGALEPNEPPFATLAPGSGPRHFAFHPDGRHVFVINEMLTTITTFAYDGRRGRLREMGTVPTLPGPNPGDASTAEIVVHPSGRFVYGSNRGHHSIVVYRFDSRAGTMSLVEHEPTGGKTPRNFVIDPTGRWPLAENQDSDSVVVFAIDPATGALTPSGGRIEVGAPVCARFLPIH